MYRLLAVCILLFVGFLVPVHAANCGAGVKDCGCGDTLITSYRLKTNLTCTGDGLHLTNNALLTCGNFTIAGTNQTGTGVTIPTGQRGRIRNCRGNGGATAGIRNFKVGVHCNGCRYANLARVLLQSNGVPGQIQGYNLQVTNGYRFTVASSTIRHAGDEGIHDSGGILNSYQKNVFEDNYTEDLYFLGTTRSTVVNNKFIPGATSATPLYIKNSPMNRFRSNTTERLSQFIGASQNTLMIGGHVAGVKLTKTTDGQPYNFHGSYIGFFRVTPAACLIQEDSGTATLTTPQWAASCQPHSTCTGTCAVIIR